MTQRCDGHRDRFICHNVATHDVQVGAHPRTGEIVFDHFCDECYDFLYVDHRPRQVCGQCGKEHPKEEFQFVEDTELCPDCRASRYLAKAAPHSTDVDPDIDPDTIREDDEDDEEADDNEVDVDED